MGDDTKAAARPSPNCIRKTKNKKNRAKNDFQCGCEIMALDSPGGSTLQCGTLLWDDMPLNSPKRPSYWNSTLLPVSISIISPQSACQSAPVCEILSNDVMSILKMVDLPISDFWGSNNGFFQKPMYTTSYIYI